MCPGTTLKLMKTAISNICSWTCVGLYEQIFLDRIRIGYVGTINRELSIQYSPYDSTRTHLPKMLRRVQAHFIFYFLPEHQLFVDLSIQCHVCVRACVASQSLAAAPLGEGLLGLVPLVGHPWFMSQQNNKVGKTLDNATLRKRGSPNGLHLPARVFNNVRRFMIGQISGAY